MKGEGKSHTDVSGPLVLESARGHFSIRSGKWKYIDGLGSGGFSDGFASDYKPADRKPGDPEAQLYDMEKDPGETTNVVSDHLNIARRLAINLKEIVDGDYTRPIE